MNAHIDPNGTGATTDLMAPVWADVWLCQERLRADYAAWHSPHSGFTPRTIVLGYGADRWGGVACAPFGGTACERATAPIEPAWQAHVGAPWCRATQRGKRASMRIMRRTWPDFAQDWIDFARHWIDLVAPSSGSCS